jgi:hypothetical protein
MARHMRQLGLQIKPRKIKHAKGLQWWLYLALMAGNQNKQGVQHEHV